MYLTEYQKASVENFMGLWNRGSLDDIPPDHASDILNMAFARKRETITRPGTNFSHIMPNGQPAVRMFDAAFSDSVLIPLACDGIGNIWRLDNPQAPPILNIIGMNDFDAINMNNRVYIAPMRVGPFDPLINVLYVWADPAFPVRPAAGARPPQLFQVIP